MNLAFRNERSKELDEQLPHLIEALHEPARAALNRCKEAARQGTPLNEARVFKPILEDVVQLWEDIETAYGDYGRRVLGLVDRFYLLTVTLNREDAVHPWLFARCREVEADPDGFLDLWAREHYKSTVITFAGVIQEVLRDPNITVGIFSHTKPDARKFLVQIKGELERNETLHRLYPDVLYASPKKDSPKWSADKGIVVRRTRNPKEATIEAHGLVDGMPTGSHFKLRVYDDVVTLESVSTPDQVKKTTNAWALSDNLGALSDTGDPGRAWHIGTRYHFADTYQDIIDRKALKVRLHAATDNGTPKGKPVFLTVKTWLDKVTKQGSAIIAAQMLQNPAASGNTLFDRTGLRFADVRPATLCVYITVDPASSRKKGSDRTAIAVIGIDAQGNLWLLDGYCHKMKLSERWQAISQLRRSWMNTPGVQSVDVGYERYGLRDAIEHFEEKMEIANDVFDIRELAWPSEGGNSKYDRIQRLEPYHKPNAGRLYLPALLDQESPAQKKMRARGEAYRIFKPVKRKDHEGNLYSLNKMYLDEYLTYPYSAHDDFLDAVSRFFDMDARKPEIIDQRLTEPQVFADGV